MLVRVEEEGVASPEKGGVAGRSFGFGYSSMVVRERERSFLTMDP